MSKNFVSYQDALDVFSEYAEEINKSIKKFSVMPNYTNFDLGTIIQYVGANSGDYVKGYFYERTASGWVQKNTQPNVSGLGTAAFLDVPASGDAAAGEVVKGNDSRLSNSRPASDVPSWAKQSTKPTYNKTEVGLGNVDNTSDSTKKTNFTGSIVDGDTGFATGGDVYTALSDKVDKVTGKGLSANDYTNADKAIVDGVTSALANKVDKVTGKGLSANDYTDEDQEVVDEVSAELSKEYNTLTGNPLSFTTDSAQVASDCKITLEPMQEGSGDPSPSNVRAISGYDGVNVVVAKKNLLNPDTFIENPGWAINKDIISCKALSENAVYKFDFKANVTYTLSITMLSGSTPPCLIVRNPNNSMTGQKTNYSNVTSPLTFSFTEDKTWDIRLQSSSSSGSSEIGDTMKLQLELGSTATDYEPYNSATDIALNLPETVYGGILDVERGELVIDRKIISIDNTWEYTYYLSKHYIYKSISNILLDTAASVLSDNTIFSGYATAAYFQDGHSYYLGDARLYVSDNSCTSLSDFVTKYGGGKLVYPLATPYTIQLTPAQVNLLKGANTVTTNGTTITLKYRDGELAKLEDLSGIGESINKLGEISGELTEKVDNELQDYTLLGSWIGEASWWIRQLSDDLSKYKEIMLCITGVNASDVIINPVRVSYKKFKTLNYQTKYLGCCAMLSTSALCKYLVYYYSDTSIYLYADNELSTQYKCALYGIK